MSAIAGAPAASALALGFQEPKKGTAAPAIPTAPTAEVAAIRNFLLPGLGGDLGYILPFRVLWTLSCFS